MNFFHRFRRPSPLLICAMLGFALIPAHLVTQTRAGGLICAVGLGWTNRLSARITAQALSQLDLPAADTLSEPVVIDVMFLYTARAVAGAGNELSIHDKVLESIAQANYLFTNSEINVRINPVYVGQISYIESGALDTDA